MVGELMGPLAVQGNGQTGPKRPRRVPRKAPVPADRLQALPGRIGREAANQAVRAAAPALMFNSCWRARRQSR
jgi:hypothetical protein